MERALTTAQLLGSTDAAQQAELQWRFSILLLIPIITFIAVPLSRVNPRQGRYSKLVPAALLYASYYVLLRFSGDLVSDGNLSPAIGMWWVHALFLLIGLIIQKPFRLRNNAAGRAVT